MNEGEIHQVIKRIRTVIHHVGTLEGSFPRILKNAPVYTRSHLIVFYEIFPDLMRLLAFSSNTLSTMDKASNLKTNGKLDHENAREYLNEMNDSLMALMREMGIKMNDDNMLVNQDVSDDETIGRVAVVDEVEEELVADEVVVEGECVLAPHAEAVEHVLEEEIPIAQDNDEEIESVDDLATRLGTGGEQLHDQDDIDALVGSSEFEAGDDTIVDADDLGALLDVSDGEDEPKSQSDIDALVASSMNDPDDDAIETIDDIDALLASAEPEDEEKSNDQSDIDALVASAQNGTSESQEADGDGGGGIEAGLNQDDHDALLGQ